MKKHLLIFGISLCVGLFDGRADNPPLNFQVGSFTFERPEAWQWVPVNSPMRKAQLKIPGATGSEPADITFFHFGEGQGGDIETNIARWAAQFKTEKEGAKPLVEKQEVAGTKITFVKTAGTFSSGMPGGAVTPLAGYALHGAILESAGGNVFVKMTGPAAIVNANEKSFVEFVNKAASSKAGPK